MQRHQLSFSEFETNFINQPDGFLSVYTYHQSNNDDQYLKQINLDMICEWRLDDGKVKFLSVNYSNKEEFDKIIHYLKLTTKMLSDKMNAKIAKLEENLNTYPHLR